MEEIDMTVSEFIFKFLYEKGCHTTYMVSGSSAMWLTDALCRNEDMNVICCHHEQAAAMSADGYGRVNGVPGCCLVTIGPGATNAITGVAQAFLDSSPMFVISGQANSRLLDYEVKTGIRQHGTQSLNLEPIVSSITKYFAAVMHPEDIRMHMEKAYYKAMDGRRGPVWIDVPVDIQNKQIPEEMEGYIVEYKKSENIDYDKIIDMLNRSEKPLIMAGYGVRSGNAVNEVKMLCSVLKSPIVTSRGGIDVIDSDNEWFVGRPGAYGDRASHFAIQQCDLLLILGSRLSVSTIGYYPQRLAKNAVKIMVDIDEKELAKEDVPIDYKYNVDVKTFVSELLKRVSVEDYYENRLGWKRHCLEMKNKYPNVKTEYQQETPLNEYWVTSKLSDKVKENANIIVDTGSVCNIVSQSWNLKDGQRYLISGGLSCMGFWATAIGAYQQGRQLIAVTGDGSTQMNIQELATLKYNQIPLKLFIYNNNGYMLIRHNQHNYMNDRFLGVGPDSGLQTPDFCRVADAYGVKNVKITNTDELDYKIDEVLSFKEPVVCEVMVQEFAPIIPRIASKVMPDGSLKAAEFDDLYPFLND
jgi:acetolactate synthase-1/2/3 large subunit